MGGGDGLVLAYGQGKVLISPISKLRRNEFISGNAGHGFQDRFIYPASHAVKKPFAWFHIVGARGPFSFRGGEELCLVTSTNLQIIYSHVVSPN